LILAINDTPIDSFPQIYGLISKIAGQSVKLSWLRGSDTIQANVVVKSDSGLNLQGEIQAVGRIGIGVAMEYKPLGFWGGLVRGIDETNSYVSQTVYGLFGFISGTISSKLIGGPVFIAQAVSRATREGFVAILLLASVISVNLCVINLIPIPVLDGGQLLFLVIEKIKGSPLSIRARAISQQVGLLFLVLLIIFVTKNDIWRINIFGW
jgi:regulator of sigma E protease